MNKTINFQSLALSILFILITLPINVAQSQGNIWHQTNGPLNVYVANLIISHHGSLIAATSLGIYRSTDVGNSWIRSDSLRHSVRVLSQSPSGSLFAGSQSSFPGTGVFRSTDDGITWINTGLVTDNGVLALLINSKGYIFTSVNGLSILRSTDDGNSWQQANTGISHNPNIDALAINYNGHIFAGTTNNTGVYRSTDDGSTWLQTGLNNVNITSFVIASNHYIYAGSSYGRCYRSTDNGAIWALVPITLSNVPVGSLASNSLNQVFAGIDGSDVYSSTDDGYTWSQTNLPHLSVHCLLTDSLGFLFAGSTDYGVYRTLNSTITSAENIQELSQTFSLSQNYPNPFNPSTNISFCLSSTSFVTLKVFDLIGREIAVLISDKLSKGNHSLQWKAAALPSGIYFYRLQTANHWETKKLIILK